MADKQEDRPNDVRQNTKPDRPRQFIQETIVRQPTGRGQMIRRVLFTAFCAVLFGVIASFCFTAARPAAQKFFGQKMPEESEPITIPKDEPESEEEQTEPETQPEPEQETEPVKEQIRSEIENYQYAIEDLDKLYNNLRMIAENADKSVVGVHSIQHEKDWFDNPIETTGQFSGMVISRTRREILILTPGPAVEAADSIEVVFADGTVLPGTLKQKDSIMGLSVVSVDASQMEDGPYKNVEAVKLGNSYGVRQGDLVVAVGAPAGIVYSSDYGFISYVVRNVQIVDGSASVFYTDAKSSAGAGTFLLNTAGEMVGWVTDRYDQNGECNMTTVVAVSDYKGALELMSNGSPVPYLGIRGQEVSEVMEETGVPGGIYVASCVTDSPAYNAGIQPGDILTALNGEKIGNLKDFQNHVEKLQPEEKIQAQVQRSNGKDEYKEIAFEVTVGTR